MIPLAEPPTTDGVYVLHLSERLAQVRLKGTGAPDVVGPRSRRLRTRDGVLRKAELALCE
jgi:hypothetical protein